MILKRDETFLVVLNLRTPSGFGTERVGTGTFVSASKGPYILTATHVAAECTDSTAVVFSDDHGTPRSVPLTEFNAALEWKHHPIADLSILMIHLSDKVKPHLQNRCFPQDHFQLQKDPPSRDEELTIVGFPHGLGTAGRYSPLTYRSFASSGLITLPRFDTKVPADFFLLENPSVGGYSGGPVFDLAYRVLGGMTSVGSKTTAHGIIHGTISDATGGKLAAVTPSFYLADLMSS